MGKIKVLGFPMLSSHCALNSFIESNLIGADRKVYYMSLAIEVDNGSLRAHSPMKNKNKPLRLSTDTRYLSNLHSFNPYNSFKNELFKKILTFFFLKWVCSTIFWGVLHPSPSAKGTLFSKILPHKN